MECPGNRLSGKFGTEITLEIMQREAREQGQILKAAHPTWFAYPRSLRDELGESVKSVRDVSKASRWGFSLGIETSNTLAGHPGQLRQCFGHAFTYHYPFFHFNCKFERFYVFRFLVIFKDRWSISVLFFLYILLPFIAKCLLKCMASDDEAGSQQTQPGCLSFLCSLCLSHCFLGFCEALVPSDQIMGSTDRRKFLKHLWLFPCLQNADEDENESSLPTILLFIKMFNKICLWSTWQVDFYKY